MNTLISSQIFPVLLGWTTSSKPWTMLCWLHRICLNMFELNWTMLLYSQMPISCWWTPLNSWSWSFFSRNMSMFAAENKAIIPCKVRPPSCVSSHL
jgi:hypothetical protein